MHCIIINVKNIILELLQNEILLCLLGSMREIVGGGEVSTNVLR